MMRIPTCIIFLHVFWLILGQDLKVTENQNQNLNITENDRKSRFFGFGIGIVRFENKYCRSSDGLDGTCYTRRQCRDLGGTPSGRCASTIGYCCIIQRGCGTTSSLNNTYFVNPGFPSHVSGSRSCQFVIQKCNSDICQVRIDFLSLTLATPNADGHCVYDSLRLTGSSVYVLPICGENSGKHVYLDFKGDSDITISISTSGSYSTSRSWYIKVAQIDCDSRFRAPSGCLMYYTGQSGQVSSFNYGPSTTGELFNFSLPFPATLPGTRQLANFNYSICIRPEEGFCSIQWSAASPNSFSVNNDTLMNFTGMNGCFTDYVIIPNPNPVQSVQSPDRFCGDSFPTVTSSAKPFTLYVVTDDREKYTDDLSMAVNDIGNLGFSLNYNQIQCNPFQMI